jgi:hypothetical protein
MATQQKQGALPRPSYTQFLMMHHTSFTSSPELLLPLTGAAVELSAVALPSLPLALSSSGSGRPATKHI